MEEVTKIATALYESSPKEVKDAAEELFKSMDNNGDGHVDLSEFLALMNEMDVKKYSKPEFFNIIDKNGNGSLDIEEVRTLYHIISSGRPFCSSCGCFIPGAYACCTKCRPDAYTLCMDCYTKKAYVKHRHYGDKDVLFLDNYSLLRRSYQTCVDGSCFTWRIENFSKLDLKELYSEAFTVGGYKWQLSIFPKAVDNNVECLGVYLNVADRNTLPDGWSRNVEYSLTVVNQINPKKTVKKETQAQFNQEVSSWGYRSFMPLNQLHDLSNGYLVNDTIVVEIDIRVPKEREKAVAHQAVDSFTWRIENFSKLNEEPLKSEVFIVGGYKWYAQIYPKGKDNGNEKGLGVYLMAADSASRYAQYSLAVMNQKDHKNTIIKEMQYQFHEEDGGWGNQCFIPLNELHDPNKGYLVNNAIVIKIVIAVLKQKPGFSHSISSMSNSGSSNSTLSVSKPESSTTAIVKASKTPASKMATFQAVLNVSTAAMNFSSAFGCTIM